MEKIIGGIKRECYPMTAAQMVHLYTISLCPTHEIVNMGTGRYLQMPLNQAALREALNRSIQRCEALRLRFWKDPETNEIWQYVVPYENEYFEYYDFSDWTEEKVNEVLDGWTHQPFDTFGGKLVRIVLVTLPGGWNGYYINLHHMIMDSYSIVTHTRDVMDIYCSLMYNLPYPSPMTSYIKSLEKDLAYEAGSKKFEKDAEYWHKQLSRPEPIYTDFTGPGRLLTQRRESGNPNQRAVALISPAAESDTVTYDLDVESTKKLTDFCEEHDIPVSVLLIHGLRTVLSKFNNNEKDVCIKNFVSRRSTVLAKKCGGVRMHCYTMRTIIEPTDTVMEALRKIDDVQKDMFRHSEYPPMRYFAEERAAYNAPQGGAYTCVGFTYQPATAKSMVPYLKGIPYKNKWYSSGRNAQALYMTAMHRPSDGGLNFHFGYQTDFANEKEIEFFYYFLGRVLFRSIENPDKTVAEIMEMV